MPIFLQAPVHNPKGPDGKGWNRIAIHGGLSMDECALKPQNMGAFFDALDTRRVRYGSYSSCNRNGQCENCPVFTKAIEWKWFGSEILVRVDEKNTPWVMNRPDKGWEEKGIPTTWANLLALKNVEFSVYQDQFGRGVMLKRVECS